MAAPENRHAGHSRKAQYSLFFQYIAGGIAAGIGAILVIVAIGNPDFMSSLRGIGRDIVSPVSKVASEGKAAGDGTIDSISGYFAAGSQNARLKRELDAAKTRLIEADALAEENARLKTLLGLRDEESKPVAMGRLIGSTSASSRRYATLSLGSRDGIAAGMPVRSPKGLIGRVVEIGQFSSRVLLITDSESIVPVRRASDGLPAAVEGRADGTLRLRLFNLGINPLKSGDAVVTSGAGGLYRPGIPVGVVWKLTSDGAIVRVLSDPAASDYVAVEPVWTVTEEPATPAPTPSSGPPKPAAT